MSLPQRLIALAIALVAAVMCLGMANWDDTDRDRKQSLYTCSVWNDGRGPAAPEPAHSRAPGQARRMHVRPEPLDDRTRTGDLRS